MNNENFRHPKTKVCKHCGERKPFTTEYFVPTKNKDILSSVCRECNNAQLDRVRSEAVKASEKKRTHKICAKCGIEKQKEEFSHDWNNKKDGRQHWCKECYSNYKRVRKDNVDTTKKCTHCHKTKNIDEFYLNAAMHDGHHSWCKECTKGRRKEQNEDDRNSDIMISPEIEYPISRPPRMASENEPIVIVEMPVGEKRIELVLECPLAHDTKPWILEQLDRILEIIDASRSISIHGMEIKGADKIARLRDICTMALDGQAKILTLSDW